MTYIVTYIRHFYVSFVCHFYVIVMRVCMSAFFLRRKKTYVIITVIS